MTFYRFWVYAALLLPGSLFAGGGDDHAHGDTPAAPVAATAQPLRVEAVSELFELVGTLEGDKLVIHLDRFTTNEPVTGATVTVEGGPLKATAAVEREGVYTVAATGLAAPGSHPLVFTVQAGQTSDLLTGDLVVAGASATAESSSDHRPGWTAALAVALVVALAAALLLAAGAVAWRRRRAALKGALQ